MSRVVVTLAIGMCFVVAVSGQSRTADGVAALARGDYQRAVEILKPLAEGWQSQDSAAQFFMAGLYETGRGVPADPLRACALYARAGSHYDSPFGRQASPLFAAYMARGQEFDEECQTLARVGFDTGFDAVTFDLGPGHFVTWTLGAATVTYQGQSKREATPYAMPGARFLSLRHEELATGPTRSLTRHFVEMFFWYPNGKPGPWKLQWHLFEVVRDEIIRIDTPELTISVDGDAPPAPEAFDVHEYATVRVDDRGDAVWAVLKGPRAATERIETDAERREERDARLARDAALKQVDWKRRSDAHRQPEMTYGDAEGCGYFQLVGWTLNRDEAIVLRANVQDLGLSAPALTFDLARESGRIPVEVYVYEAAQARFDFCSDAKMGHGPDFVGPEVWHAVAGTITIDVSPGGVDARNPRGPRATVILNNLVLRNDAGAVIKVSHPVKLSAIVGAVFG